jgi:hypothetical protein
MRFDAFSLPLTKTPKKMLRLASLHPKIRRNPLITLLPFILPRMLPAIRNRIPIKNNLSRLIAIFVELTLNIPALIITHQRIYCRVCTNRNG